MKDGVIKRTPRTLAPISTQVPLLVAVACAIVGIDLDRLLDDMMSPPTKPLQPTPIDLFDSEVCGHQVTVTPDGQLFCYPVCTNGVTLDEIRLAAASHYLDRRGLTRDQYRYWSGIRQTTQLKNFESIRDRGRR